MSSKICRLTFFFLLPCIVEIAHAAPMTALSELSNKTETVISPKNATVGVSQSKTKTDPIPSQTIGVASLQNQTLVGLPNPLKDIPENVIKTLANPERANNAWMRTCKNNVAICCWTQGRVGNNPNSDVCNAEVYINDRNFLHCHGTVFAPGRPIEEAMITMNYIQIYDHLNHREYYGPIPGFNECGCAENMPQIKRADVSMLNLDQRSNPNIDASNVRSFNSGKNNDLTATFKHLYNNQNPINPVPNCIKNTSMF